MYVAPLFSLFFFFNDTATTEIYTLSLHDALPISGRCAAILSNGKRCPNAALPGSRYCGVPAHQELAVRETESPDVEPVVTESEPELEELADELAPDAEAVGPAVPEPDVEPLESEAPADAAATHGPPAPAIADAGGEAARAIAPPRVAPQDEIRAGIQMERVPHEGDEKAPAAVAEPEEGSSAA